MRNYLGVIIIFILFVRMANSVYAANDIYPEVIVVIEDARHISDDTFAVGYNDTIGNFSGSELDSGQEVLVGSVPGTFHESLVTKGSFGPDCKGCHGYGGIAPVQIDIEAFEKSVHANLNSIANGTASADPVNKACWACHGNGSKPLTHSEEFKSSRSCSSCHSFGTYYNATRTGGHTKAGINLSIRTDCETCHMNAVVKKEVDGSRFNVSHYGGKIIYNSTDCLSCHRNSTSAKNWGNASQIYSHTRNGSCTECHSAGRVKNLHDANLTMPAERTCVGCHTSEGAVQKYGGSAVIRTHYPGAPEGLGNTTSVNASITCSLCHNVSNATLHDRSLSKNILNNNNSQNNASSFCYQCHGAEGSFPYKPSVQIPRLVHGNQSEHITLGMKMNCETCHDSGRVSRFHRPTSSWDRPVGRVVEGTAAGCTDCHNTHVQQNIPNVTCLTCHSSYDASHYSGMAVEKINRTLTCGACHNEIKNQFHNLTVPEKDRLEPMNKPGSPGNISCDSCHNATGKETFHFSEFPAGSIQSPGWKNWKSGSRVNKCSDCHVKFGGEYPFNATNLTEPLHRAAENCTLCHGGDSSIGLHVLQRSNTAPYIRDIIVIPQRAYAGEKVSLSGLAVSGWEAPIMNVEYFIDTIDEGGKGINMTMGKDLASQVREVFADIDTSRLEPGTHIISIHAQDSKGRWGDAAPAPLLILKKNDPYSLFKHWELIFLISGLLILIYILKKIR